MAHPSVLPNYFMNHLAPCGLKARATLAWGNAPGRQPSVPGGLKVRAKSPPRHKINATTSSVNQPTSIPNKLFIKRHPVLVEHGTHLGLKITPLMMHGLPIDVSHQCVTIAQPHRKRSIPTLPTELRELRPLRLDPLRRRDLEPLHQTRNRLSTRKKHRQVDVIGNPADSNANIVRSVENSREVRVHLHANVVMEQRSTILRTEHNVNQHVGKRLGHGRKYSAGLQPAIHPYPNTWGVAPGHGSAGLQPARTLLLSHALSSQAGVKPPVTACIHNLLPTTRQLQSRCDRFESLLHLPSNPKGLSCSTHL